MVRGKPVAAKRAAANRDLERRFLVATRSVSSGGHTRLVLGMLTLIAAAGLAVAGLLTAQVREDVNTLRGRVVELERRSPAVAEQLGGVRSELAAIQRTLTEIKKDLRELNKETRP